MDIFIQAVYIEQSRLVNNIYICLFLFHAYLKIFMRRISLKYIYYILDT